MWLQYIIYAYFVYVYVMLCVYAGVCVSGVFAHVYIRVLLCKQVHLFCVLYECIIRLWVWMCYKMKNEHALCTLGKLIDRARERNESENEIEKREKARDREREKERWKDRDRGRGKQKQDNRESEILGRSR